MNSNTRCFSRIVSAYENFIDYLRDETITIDYTYVWDLICKTKPEFI